MQRVSIRCLLGEYESAMQISLLGLIIFNLCSVRETQKILDLIGFGVEYYNIKGYLCTIPAQIQG